MTVKQKGCRLAAGHATPLVTRAREESKRRGRRKEHKEGDHERDEPGIQGELSGRHSGGVSVQFPVGTGGQRSAVQRDQWRKGGGKRGDEGKEGSQRQEKMNLPSRRVQANTEARHSLASSASSAPNFL